MLLSTGYDNDGGYAEFVVANEEYVDELHLNLTTFTQPPCCAGAVPEAGALRRTQLPAEGRLGIYGFARAPPILRPKSPCTGSESPCDDAAASPRWSLQQSLGAASVQGAHDVPPEPLDAAILSADRQARPSC